MKFRLLGVALLALSLSTGCQLFSSQTEGESSTALGKTFLDKRSFDKVPTLEPTAEPALEELSTTSAIDETPSPTLFDVAWDDLDVYRSGLVAAEQRILDQLPNINTYHIRLKISEQLNVVEGREEVLVTNLGDAALEEIYLHLFPNLLGGELSISNLTLNGDGVTPAYERGSSIMRLALDEPLEPGSQVVVGLDFATVVPTQSERNYGIFAYMDDVVALAHFYPLIAVYDDEGWNVEPPVPQGDVLYADASLYLVTVTAPSDQVIVTSGVEIAREVGDGSQVITVAAGPARDFYLAGSARYTVHSRQEGEIRINSYAPAQFAESAEAALDYAAFALDSFGRRFGPYPYTELDIVTTPTSALGVEYPGVFANAIRIYGTAEENSSGIPNRALLESTTVHETGHQWFYNVVGNDQLDEPWLDEALAQYATWQYYVDRYGRENAQGFYQSLVSRWNRLEQANIPIGLPVSAYRDAEYGAIVYGRGPIFIDELARTMGQITFDEFLQDYVRTFRWANASTEKFRALAEQHCRCDLMPLFDAWVFSQ